MGNGERLDDDDWGDRNKGLGLMGEGMVVML